MYYLEIILVTTAVRPLLASSGQRPKMLSMCYNGQDSTPCTPPKGINNIKVREPCSKLNS